MKFRKYVYSITAVLIISTLVFFYYTYNQNLKLKSQIEELYTVKAENAKLRSEAERIKFTIEQETEKCNGIFAKQGGDFGEYEYCKRLSDFTEILRELDD